MAASIQYKVAFIDTLNKMFSQRSSKMLKYFWTCTLMWSTNNFWADSNKHKCWEEVWKEETKEKNYEEETKIQQTMGRYWTLMSTSTFFFFCLKISLVVNRLTKKHLSSFDVYYRFCYFLVFSVSFVALGFICLRGSIPVSDLALSSWDEVLIICLW